MTKENPCSKRILFCFSMPRGDGYVGGVASMLHTYMGERELFSDCGWKTRLFDHVSPAFHDRLPSKCRNILYGISQRRAILNDLKRNPVDAVHIHTSRSFLYLKDVWLARAIKRRRGVPVFVTVHVGAAQTVFERIGCFEGQTIRWINRYVDRVIFLADAIYGDFIRKGMERGKGTVLGNFHDLADGYEEVQLPEKAKLQLLFVGAIHREKGVLELLNAMTQLAGLDVRLDLCGKPTDPSVQAEVDALVEALGERVCLHGYVSGAEKSALFHRADVLVLPSYHEGFPLVVVEGLASGCAVIATPVGAVPEILSGDNVRWVAIGSSEEICREVSILYHDPALLNAMQETNRELSCSFSVEKHIRRLCRIYGE